MVILAWLVTGMCLASVYPPAMKLVATWFKTNRGLALGAVIAAITFGSALPHLVRASGGVGWATVAGTASAAILLGAALSAGVIREGLGPAQSRGAALEPRLLRPYEGSST